MKTKKLYVIVGNIGSGKTTFIKHIIADMPETIVVSRDDLRYMIGAGKYVFNLSLEPMIFESALCIIKKFMLVGVVNIIVDETNMSQEYRQDYIFLAKQYNYKTTAIVMPVLDKKTCVDRRMNNPHDQSDRTIWEGVWDKFNTIYQIPTVEEGFDKVVELT